MCAANKEMLDTMGKADQELNTRVRYSWLPYLVAALGISFSLLVWHQLYNNLRLYFEVLHEIKHDLPWLVFIFGAIISIIIGALIRGSLYERYQADNLAIMNAKLKQEIHDSNLIKESKQKLEHALLQGQKLQAMGTLAGGIAHDFNNILYAIIGYVEMAREDVEKDSQLYENLGHVLEACQRGQELVGRILTFSRRQQHQLNTINIKPTIETALSLLQQTIPASVILNFDIDEDMEIHGNKTLIHQVLVNLINNAVDAMDGEGSIDITAQKILANDQIIATLPDAQNSDYCMIVIKDSGHGMEKSTMERIFEPFYTTKEVGKGTGLGLSIVHSIIKEHKGEITVSSELGKGTTFTILLPEHAKE